MYIHRGILDLILLQTIVYSNKLTSISGEFVDSIITSTIFYTDEWYQLKKHNNFKNKIIYQRCYSITEFIETYWDYVNGLVYFGQSVMIDAAKNNNYNILHHCLEHGSIPTDQYIIEIIIDRKFIDLFELCLQYNITINASNIDSIIDGENTEMFELCLKYKKIINKHHIEYIISHGADKMLDLCFEYDHMINNYDIVCRIIEDGSTDKFRSLIKFSRFSRIQILDMIVKFSRTDLFDICLEQDIISVKE